MPQGPFHLDINYIITAYENINNIRGYINVSVVMSKRMYFYTSRLSSCFFARPLYRVKDYLELLGLKVYHPKVKCAYLWISSRNWFFYWYWDFTTQIRNERVTNNSIIKVWSFKIYITQGDQLILRRLTTMVFRLAKESLIERGCVAIIGIGIGTVFHKIDHNISKWCFFHGIPYILPWI